MKNYKYTPDIQVTISPNHSPAGIIYLFPGQGSAKPKMFSNLLGDEIFKNYIKLANEFLLKMGRSTIDGYLFGDVIPESDLSLLRNISLFTCEVALFYKVQKMFPPKKVIGHSFGEFAALVCCGALHFEEALAVVYQREIACPVEDIGGMIVVGKIKTHQLQIAKISELYIANINSYNQSAYSYRAEDYDHISNTLRRSRVPFVNLYNLKYPYHCAIMESAKVKMQDALKKMSFKFDQELSATFFSNVTHKEYNTMRELREDVLEILSEQLVRKVDFVGAIELCFAQNEFSFFECGPDNTLEVFTKNIYKEYHRAGECFFHSLPKSLEQQFYSPDLIKSKWFKTLGTILTDVTGYKIKELEVNYDFQKDLGIDSIKKAEVLYKTLNAENIESVDQISLSSFKTVGEFVEYMEKYADEAETNSKFESNKFNFSVFEIFQKERKSFLYSTIDKDQMSFEYLSLFSLLEKSNLSDIFLDLKNILLSLKEREISKLHVLLPVDNLKSYGIASFVKSFVLDRPYALKIHYLENETQPLVNSESIEVYYKHGKIFNDYFKKINFSKQMVSLKNIVFIGAHKGLGSYLNDNSIFLKETTVHILGRSLEDKNLGRIRHYKVDINDYTAVQKLFKKIGSIDLVINAAGIEISKSLELTTVSDFEMVQNVKLHAAVSLADYCEQILNCPYVHFSSIVGYFGGRGQYTYAFANEMARKTLLDHKGKNLVINWPALDKVGMTENVGIYQRLKESGFSMLSAQDAVRIFDQMLASFISQDLAQDYFILTQRDFYILDHHLKYNETDNEYQNQFNLKSMGLHKFEKEVYLETSPELKDHCVNQIFVYPASFLLMDSFFLLNNSSFRLHTEVVSIDFEIQNVSLFHQGRIQLNFSIMEDVSSLAKLVVKSNLVDYSTLLINAVEGIEVKEYDQDFCLNLELDSLYNENVITFGPHFQMAHKLVSDQNKTYCLITGVYTSPWQLIEAGFQGVSVLCGANGGGLAVPHKIEGIKVDMDAFFNLSQEDDFKVYAEFITKKNQNVMGRFFIYKNDKCIVECQKLYSKIVRMFRKELLIFKP